MWFIMFTPFACCWSWGTSRDTNSLPFCQLQVFSWFSVINGSNMSLLGFPWVWSLCFPMHFFPYLVTIHGWGIGNYSYYSIFICLLHLAWRLLFILHYLIIIYSAVSNTLSMFTLFLFVHLSAQLKKYL